MGLVKVRRPGFEETKNEVSGTPNNHAFTSGYLSYTYLQIDVLLKTHLIKLYIYSGFSGYGGILLKIIYVKIPLECSTFCRDNGQFKLE